MFNYYETLEIPTDADPREIKKAYHRLARDLHPDKAGTPEDARVYEERFAVVTAAYNTLKDKDKRAEHDRRLQKSQSTSTASGTSSTPSSTPNTAVLNAGCDTPAEGAASGQAPENGTQFSNRVSLGLTPEKIAIAQKAYARGLQYFKENQFLKAIDFFEAAIKNNDTESNYHARLAVALIQAHRSATRAIEAAQKAIELDPYRIEHKFILATIFETIGSSTNAAKVYEEILRWDAGNQRAQQGLREVSRKKSKFSFAVDGKESFFKQLFNRLRR